MHQLEVSSLQMSIQRKEWKSKLIGKFSKCKCCVFLCSQPGRLSKYSRKSLARATNAIMQSYSLTYIDIDRHQVSSAGRNLSFRLHPVMMWLCHRLGICGIADMLLWNATESQSPSVAQVDSNRPHQCCSGKDSKITLESKTSSKPKYSSTTQQRRRSRTLLGTTIWSHVVYNLNLNTVTIEICIKKNATILLIGVSLQSE